MSHAVSSHPRTNTKYVCHQSEDLLQTEDNVKDGVEGGWGEGEGDDGEQEKGAHSDAVLSQLIGTLAISDKGDSRFVGNTGAEVHVCCHSLFL